MNKRIEEITNSIGSFSRDLYHKSEVLPELFKLQDEVVNLTFNKDHADNGRLRLWDVEAYIEQLNAECGYVVDEQLQRFKDHRSMIPVVAAIDMIPVTVGLKNGRAVDCDTLFN